MFNFIRTYQLDIMLALSSACIVFTLLLVFTQFMEKKRKTILIIMELTASLLLFFDRLAYVYRGQTTHTAYVMVRLSNFLVFFLTSQIVFIFNAYLIDFFAESDESKRVPKRLVFTGAGAACGMLLAVVAHFTGLYYYYDEMNVYHRGPGFLISYVIPLVCPLIQFTVVLQYRRRVSRLIYISLLLYIFVPIAMAVIQIFAYGISITNMAVVMVSICAYIFAYLDINEEVVRLHESEMYRSMQEKKRIKRLLDQTVTALVSAIEKRDVFAEGHSVRVASLARRIAEMEGRNEEECEQAYYTGLLHNVGLITTPDVILEKSDGLTEEEEQVIRSRMTVSGEILAGISEYGFLKECVQASHENYDGSGYPRGLKGNAIPENARILAAANAYDTMTRNTRTQTALPQQIVRERFIMDTGRRFDPKIADIMIRLIDEDNARKVRDGAAHVEKELKCGAYRDAVSLGIPVTRDASKISFICVRSNNKEGGFSEPSIILFDCYDRHVHDDPRVIKANRYVEYGELWFDGHYVSTVARDMRVEVSGQDVEAAHTKSGSAKGQYEIEAARYEDHLRIKMTGMHHVVDAIVALPNKTKAAYIGLTGENCRLKDITVLPTGESVGQGDIPRIVAEETFIDRMESDIPNVQIDRHRSAYTEHLEIKDELRLDFHTMTLPSANFIWNCPYILLYHADDGKVGGAGYTPYALVKINGECESDYAGNRFSMKKGESFPGWDQWRTIHKEGMECSVTIAKRGSKVTLTTENLGIAIENTFAAEDRGTHVYAALTGDQVALTDIRVHGADVERLSE